MKDCLSHHALKVYALICLSGAALVTEVGDRRKWQTKDGFAFGDGTALKLIDRGWLIPSRMQDGRVIEYTALACRSTSEAA